MERTQSSNMETRLDAMKELAKLSTDVTFATEFINMDGIIVLTRLVESGTKLLSHYSEMLAFTLTAFLELMDHGIVSWDMVSITFIKQIAGYVSQPMVDVSILQRSLAILESMVLNSQSLYQKIAEEITVGQLISHLQVSNQEIQTYAIALINALFLKAPEDKRQVCGCLFKFFIRALPGEELSPTHPLLCRQPSHGHFPKSPSSRPSVSGALRAALLRKAWEAQVSGQAP
ncbi:engulfment and cell motility protein 2-like [Leptonychotes weddellii]|uniref:Engulfment and cell motility protein 2-like n=1 Tax=Leptonychotes weddellii TaxID=9713 RepID=A0A7F8QAP6_LEPWE|nr:engulfment and cell motility protein 2-like [Leptonychotes weddellii]